MRHRFIPTRVGNTTRSSPPTRRAPVHPHARGEHNGSQVGVGDGNGSSPRAWGTQPIQIGDAVFSRFIPTRVGNTPPTGSRAQAAPVHPHARGEHRCGALPTCAKDGSSPRAWGTRHRIQCDCFLLRFIPTRVGNTSMRSLDFDLSGGSSPRAWGTPSNALENIAILRFIPTRVGNTEAIPPWLMTICGSSPRAWGTQIRRPGLADCRRFIPTRVGNTPALRRSGRNSLVHPHARGEHQFSVSERG